MTSTQRIFRATGTETRTLYAPEPEVAPARPTIADLVPVTQIMHRDVICARRDLPADEVAELMMRHHVGCVPIVEDPGRPIGMVTKLDLVEQLLASDAVPRTANELMMPLAITLGERASVAHAAALMAAEDVHHIPIVDSAGRMIGVVSSMDVVRWLARNDGFRGDAMKAAGALLLAACATTAPVPPNGGPRGLRASDHLEAASDHDERARARLVSPDYRSVDTRPVLWTRTWDPGVEHERLARIHRSEAAAIHTAYEEACGDRPVEQVSISPIRRFAIANWNTSTGVILYIDPSAVSPDRLVADLRCHRAWMMLAPTGMDHCPLDLPGLVVDARGDLEGITLSIIVRDPGLVPELQRRAALDLESHQRHEVR